LLREAGFEIAKACYLIVNDLTYVDAELEEYLRVSSFKDIISIILKELLQKTKYLKAPSISHSKAKTKSKTI